MIILECFWGKTTLSAPIARLLFFSVFGLVLSLLVLSPVHAQVVVGKAEAPIWPQVPPPSDASGAINANAVYNTDPSLLDHIAEDRSRRVEGCIDNFQTNCQGLLQFRFSDVRVTSDVLSYTVDMRALSAPTGYPGGGGPNNLPDIDADNLGNVIRNLAIGNTVSEAAFGLNPHFNAAIGGTGQCTISDAQGGFLESSGAFEVSAVNPDGNDLGAALRIGTAGVNSSWSSVLAAVPFLFLGSRPHLNAIIPTPTPGNDAWVSVFSRTCTVISGQASNPARLALTGSIFSEVTQQIASNVGPPFAGQATNQMWHYPLDGEPAIIDVQIGNAIVDDQFYVDVTFSEGVFGSNSADAPVDFSEFGFFGIDRVRFLDRASDGIGPGDQFIGREGFGSNPVIITDTSAPGVNVAGIAPVRAEKVGGGALEGGEETIRLFFNADVHPLNHASLTDYVAGSTRTITWAVRPQGDESIYDADGNQLHGGSDDTDEAGKWHLRVLHDYNAPHITAAEVAPASASIELTFSEAVWFHPTDAAVDPSAADFVLTRYNDTNDSLDGQFLTVESVAATRNTDTNVVGVTLALASATPPLSSEDRVDIGFAQQVKDVTIPSAASVFDIQEDSSAITGESPHGEGVQYATTFPRIGAQNQVGSLQMRGPEVYAINFTEVLTGESIATDGSTISATLSETADISLGRSDTQPEGNNLDSGTIWGMLISRSGETQGESTVNLNLQITGASSDIRLGSKEADGATETDGYTGITGDLSVAIPVVFPSNEDGILVYLYLPGDIDPTTGDREIAVSLAVIDPDTQNLQADASLLTITIEEDDDAPLVFGDPDSDSNGVIVLAGASEDALQSGILSDFTDSGGAITVSEAGSPNGIDRVIIEMSLQNAQGEQITLTSDAIRERLSFDSRTNNVLTRGDIQSGTTRFAITGSATDVALPNELEANNGLVVLSLFNSSNPITSFPDLRALLGVLDFFLLAGDDDIGSHDARIRITLVPPTGSNINQAAPALTYEIPITADNDQPTAAVSNQDFSDQEGAASPLNVELLTDISAVESGQAIDSIELADSNVTSLGSIDLFSSVSSPTLAMSGSLVELTIPQLNDNAWGSYQFRVQITDSAGGVSVFPSLSTFFTWTVTPINDPPTGTAPVDIAVEEGVASVTLAFTDISGGVGEDGLPNRDLDTGPTTDMPAELFAATVGSFQQGLVASDYDITNTLFTDGDHSLTVDLSADTDLNGVSMVTFNVVDADGGTGGASTSPLELVATVSVTPVNDAPTVVLSDGNLMVDVGSTEALGSLTITDPDWVANDDNRYGDGTRQAADQVREGSMLVVELSVADGSGSLDDSLLSDEVRSGVDIQLGIMPLCAASSASPALPGVANFNNCVESTPGATVSGSARRTLTMSGGGVITVTEESAGVANPAGGSNSNYQRLTLEVTSDSVLREEFQALARFIQINVQGDSYSEDNRRVRVTFTDSGNDGIEIGDQIPLTSTVLQTITLQGDAGLVLTKGGSPTTGANELDLQRFSVLIDGGATVLESGTPANDQGVAAIEIALTLQNAAGGAFEGNSATGFTGSRIAISDTNNGRDIDTTLISGIVVAPDGPDLRVVSTDGAPMTADEAQQIVRRVRLFLTQDDNDVGGMATVEFRLEPPGNAGNQQVGMATYNIDITQENDPPVADSTSANFSGGDFSTQEDTAGLVVRTISLGLSAQETGQTIAVIEVVPTIAQPTPTAGSTSGPSLFRDGTIPTGTLVSNGNVQVAYSLASNAWGAYAFQLRVTDSVGASVIFPVGGGSYTITIAPINDPPTITMGGPLTFAEGSTAPRNANFNVNGGAGEEGRPAGDLAFAVGLDGRINPGQVAAYLTDNLEVTGSLVTGGLRIPGDYGLAFDDDTSPSELFVTLRTVALNRLSPDLNGISDITLTAVDTGGGEGGGAALSASATVRVEITPVNDRPTLSFVASEGNVPLDSTVVLTSLTIGDPDWVANDNNFYATGLNEGPVQGTPDQIRLGSVLSATFLEGSTTATSLGARAGVTIQLGPMPLCDYAGGAAGLAQLDSTRDWAAAGVTDLGACTDIGSDGVAFFRDFTIDSAGTGTEATASIQVRVASAEGMSRFVEVEVLSGNVLESTFHALVRLIQIHVAADDFAGDTPREVEIAFTDSGNDGAAIGSQSAEAAAPQRISLSSDSPLAFELSGNVLTLSEDDLQAAFQALGEGVTVALSDSFEGSQINEVGARLDIVMDLQDGTSAGSRVPQQTILDNLGVSGQSLSAAGSSVIVGGVTWTIIPVSGTSVRFEMNDGIPENIIVTANTNVVNLINALNFQLTEDQNDPGSEATFTLTAYPSPDQPNPSTRDQEITVTITSSNDVPTLTFAGAAISADEDSGLTLSVGNFYTDLDAIESDQIADATVNFEVTSIGNDNLGAGTLAERFGRLFSGPFPDLTLQNNRYGQVGYRLTPNDGQDDGDPETGTITVAAVDDTPSFTVLVVSGPEGSSLMVEIQDISNGPEELPPAAANPRFEFQAEDNSFLAAALVLAGNNRFEDATASTASHVYELTGFDRNMNGESGLTVTMNEGASDSGMAGDTVQTLSQAVSIRVAPVNDAPVLTVQSGSVVSGVGETILSVDITDPDIDVRDAGASPSQSGIEYGFVGGTQVLIEMQIAGSSLDQSDQNDRVDAEAVDIGLRSSLSPDVGGAVSGVLLGVGGPTVSVQSTTPESGEFERFMITFDSSGNQLMVTTTQSFSLAADSDDNPNTQGLEAMIPIGSMLSLEEMQAFLSEAVAISIDDMDTSINLDRAAVITVVDPGNDGMDGNSGSAATSVPVSVRLLSDDVDPVLPADLEVGIETGDTRATLTWVTARDSRQENGPIVQLRDNSGDGGGLRYTIEITDMVQTNNMQQVIFGEADYDGTSYDEATGYFPTGDGNVRYTITRADVTLIPGRAYRFVLSVADLANNMPAPNTYAGMDATMTTDRPDVNDDGIHDELVDEVSSIAAYCGSQFGDADSDGVPNNIEVALGLECRADEAGADIDFVGANDPQLEITFDAAGLATGATAETGAAGTDFFLIPGLGEVTPVSLGAASCSDCETLVAYEDTELCQSNPGQARPDGDVGTCPPLVTDEPVSLGSFSTQVLWIGTDNLGNQVRLSRALYVQPPVGFDVTRVTVPGSSNMVSVPVSVAVSDNVPTAGNLFDLSVDVVGSLSNNQRSSEIALTFADADLPSAERLTISNVFVASELIGAADLATDSTRLFILANAEVTLVPPFERPTEEFEFGCVANCADNGELPVSVESGSLPTFNLGSSPDVGIVEATVTVRRQVPGDESIDESFVITRTIPQGGSSPGVSLNNEVMTRDFMFEEGDTLEISAVSSATAATLMEGSFILVIIEPADTDGDGVPNEHEILEVDARSALQVHNAIGDPQEDHLETSASGDPLLSLGTYSLAAAQLEGADEESDYSAAVHSNDIGLTELPGGLSVSDVATGVFDFAISDIGVGDVAAVVIPLLRTSGSPSLLYKFTRADGWAPFITTENERVYSAPTPCPSINASRGLSDGFSWQQQTGAVPAGTGCLLLELQDGGMNDADGTANGAIHDPNALAVALPQLNIVVTPTSGQVSASTPVTLTVTTDPEITDLGRLVTVSLVITPSSGMLTVTPDQNGNPASGDPAELILELSASSASRTVVVNSSESAPTGFTATATCMSGCGGTSGAVSRGGGGGAIGLVWLLLLTFGVLSLGLYQSLYRQRKRRPLGLDLSDTAKRSH